MSSRPKPPAGPARRGALLGLTLLAALLAPRPAAAGDPSLVWRTIETEHFVINYYEPNGDIARRVAQVAERAHRTLAPVLRHSPREKTLVVISDDTDGANGFASVAPRNLIHLFATAPSGESTLNDHDDWLYGLVAHEYAHILHLDTVGGLPAIWNRIFGKTWMPNQIQPRWFIEGLATYEESKRSSGGRTRNAIYDMYLRMAVLGDQTLRLDEVSSGPRRWPHGNAAYLYGSHFLKYVADRYGDDKLAAMSKTYGRHPIPWNLGRAVRRAVGKNFDELYDEWRRVLWERYALQRDRVLRRGLREGRKRTDTGEGNAAPRYRPDGKEIVWLRSDGYSHARYRAMPSAPTAPPARDARAGDRRTDGRDGGPDPADDRTRDVARIDGAGSFDFTPDGRSIVVERMAPYRTYYQFLDLYRRDLASGELVRLTRGLRAAEPDVSPDGTQVAFTINGRSKTRLAVMPLARGGRPRILWQGPGRWDQVFTPAWSPDGTRLAFSAWTQGGFRDLWVVEVATGRATRLTDDRAVDAVPRWSPDGRTLYFTSDRSGIYNLYALDLETRELAQVTNVLGGVFTFDVSPDGGRVVYSGYEEGGFEIYELALDRAGWLEPEPYVNDRPDPTAVGDDEVAVSAPRPYRPLETLAPRAWTANLAVDSFGSALTIATGGNDVAGFHNYGIGASVGFTRGDVGFGAGYGYNRLWPALGFAAGRGLGRPAGLVLDGMSVRYTEEIWAASARIGLPILRTASSAADLQLSYDFDWLRGVDIEVPLDPGMAVPRLPETGIVAGVAARAAFSNVRRYVFAVGPQEGRALSAGARLNHPAFGSDFRTLELSWRWQEYLAMPWPGHHSLALRLSGGWETTERLRDGPFVLGGLPQQDILSSILASSRAGSSGYLRGYAQASLRGRKFHLANAEYRVPIVDVEQGLTTLPAYVRRLHGAVLVDAGHAYSGDLALADLRVAVGGALRLDVTFGFFVDGTFELGYARGLNHEGRDEIWLLLTQGI